MLKMMSESIGAHRVIASAALVGVARPIADNCSELRLGSVQNSVAIVPIFVDIVAGEDRAAGLRIVATCRAQPMDLGVLGAFALLVGLDH